MVMLVIEEVDSDSAHFAVNVGIVAEYTGCVSDWAGSHAGDLDRAGEDDISDEEEAMKGEPWAGCQIKHPDESAKYARWEIVEAVMMCMMWNLKGSRS